MHTHTNTHAHFNRYACILLYHLQIKSVKDLIDDAKKIATPEAASEVKSKQRLNKEDKQQNKEQPKTAQKPIATGNMNFINHATRMQVTLY